MRKPFDDQNDWQALHDRIVGLGEQSSRKSYYPELRKRVRELEEEIEHRQRIEESLHENALILEEEIAERQRLEEEILRARKLESLGVLAGGIAHDFNNLLTGILGNITVAHSRAAGNDALMVPLTRALQAVERATDLTRQLLTFSKGGAPVKQLASLADIIRDSAQFALRGSNVSCIFVIDENLRAAEVDVGQISQVISNLVINADQAMPHGGTITITAQNIDIATRSAVSVSSGRYVQIAVADQGTGIDPDKLPFIFDPYFTTKEQGNGLGLASVHSIVSRHGGSIRVSSEPGSGAVFTMLLPASEQVAENNGAANGGIVTGKGRILVMDDETMICEVAADILDMLGYEAVICDNGTEAVELYHQALRQQKPFNAVMLDLTIPGGRGGEQVMAQIKALHPDAIGIVASGYCTDPIMASFGQYGFSAAIPKPFTLKQVSDTLARLLQ